MDEADRLLLKSYLVEGRCPTCDRLIPEGQGVGSGSLDDGLFCQLDCFVAFHYRFGRPRFDTEIDEITQDGDDL